METKAHLNAPPANRENRRSRLVLITGPRRWAHLIGRRSAERQNIIPSKSRQRPSRPLTQGYSWPQSHGKWRPSPRKTADIESKASIISDNQPNPFNLALPQNVSMTLARNWPSAAHSSPNSALRKNLPHNNFHQTIFSSRTPSWLQN